MRVALINMPSSVAISPSPAVGILKAYAQRAGHECDDIYANVKYAAYIGLDTYRRIFDEHDLLAGNFLFAHLANDRTIDTQAYFTAAIQRRGIQDEEVRDVIAALQELVVHSEDFCQRLLAELDWGAYDCFGFSSTYQQQAATIAFAKILKRHFPKTPILCGGANFHAEMGPGWLFNVPAFDFVCTAEGEQTFVSLLNLLAGSPDIQIGKSEAFSDIPNLAYRFRTEVRVTETRRFQLSPDIVPDYANYYHEAKKAGLPTHSIWNYHRLPVETSRGCWWGAKQHCVFCGLNGPTMVPDEIDAAGAFKLVTTLCDEYNVRDVFFVDNIMPRHYPKTLFPALAEAGYALNIFYETKVNLTVDELRQMARGGVKQLQPGIESLSTRVLGLMKKGSSAYQGIFFLRWCKYFGISVSWNLLWGIPGEELADYEPQLDLIGKCAHLEPPGSVPETVVQRFSPMHAKAETFGIQGLRPAKVFTTLFPDYLEAADSLSYFFDHRGRLGIERDYAEKIYVAIEQWRLLYREGATFTHARLPGRKVMILDGRQASEVYRTTFGFPASFLYEACSYRWQTISSLLTLVARLGEPVGTEFIKTLLEGFVERGLMMQDDGIYLSLSVPESDELRYTTSERCFASFMRNYGAPVENDEQRSAQQSVASNFATISWSRNVQADRAVIPVERY